MLMGRAVVSWAPVPPFAVEGSAFTAEEALASGVCGLGAPYVVAGDRLLPLPKAPAVGDLDRLLAATGEAWRDRERRAAIAASFARDGVGLRGSRP